MRVFLLLLFFTGIANANVVEQRINRNGIYIRVPYGREITITREEILAAFLQNGRDSTRTIIRQRIESEIGAELLPEHLIDIEFDDDGTPTELTIHNGERSLSAVVSDAPQ